MAGKITDYPTTTSLIDEDLFDLSKYDGVSAYATNAIKWEDILKEIQIDLTFNNLYNNNGTIGTGRTATLTDSLSFVSGQVIAAASAAGYASLNIPSGVDPTVPVDGDLWFNGTNLYFRDGGTSVDLLGGDGNGMFDSSNNATGWGVTAFNIPATTTATHATGASMIWTTQNNGTSQIFNTNAINKNNNLIWQEFGTNVGQLVYDNVSSGVRGDGFKFFAKNTFTTDGETLWLDKATDNVVIPNGNLGIGTNTPSEKLEVAGNTYVNGLIGCNVSPIAGQSLTINSTGSTTEKAIQIRTVANIERFFIQGDGKSELTGRLGINDTTIQGAQNYMIWVKGDVSASKIFGLADNAGNLKMEMSSVGRLTLNSNDTGTQVGFGTNSAFSTTVGILGKTGNIYALKVGVGANVNKLNVKGNNDNYGVGIMVDGHDEANLKIGASTTTHSSINFVNGVAPTSPNNGDFWFDGTDLFIRVSGTTYTLTKT